MYAAVVNPHFILYSWCWWKLHIGEVDSLVNWCFDYSKKNMIYANNLEHCPCHFTVFPLSFYGSKPRQNNMTTWVGSICMRTMESKTHLCRAPPEFTMQLIFWTYPFWSRICVLSIVCMPLMTYLLSFSIVDCWVFFFLPVISETKNQWARDDPAFVVILILFLVFATSAYCAAYGESASHAALTITSVVFFHFLFAGIVLATLCW
jgi:hypothetical protein